MNKRIVAILMIFSVLLGAGGMILATSLGVGGAQLLTSADAEVYNGYLERYGKLDTLMNFVESYYYQPVDESQLLEGAYKGMFEALGDKYSEYVSYNKADAFLEEVALEFGGIGMAFYIDDGYVCADSIYVDSPADKAGIKVGDIITKVNGEDIKGQDSTVIRDKIRGPKGTNVELTYQRDGKEYVVTITRAIISEITVSSVKLDKSNVDMDVNLGYIEIAAFGSGTAKEFAKALSDMEDMGVEGLVIDLRDNGGGLVDQAVEVADMLMNKGTVVYAEAQDGKRTYYTTTDGRTKLPYVLLVNGYTASASEILAVGIQSNDEAKIVGTKTYGKGIIQEARELSDGSVIKLTRTQYYSPSGNPIHKVGVTPDYIVELPAPDPMGFIEEDTQLLKAIELLK